ncbi:MAG: NAD(P)/FAD-dependent oxidoreductase [Atribacterota bacterium]|nr:NAD(P)/FAD-dependent oxidoreductase [Atribacterota bacterium]
MMKSKVIIIGGGIAGLSAGIFGQKDGFETEIFEMHTVPGGQCTAWKREGYMFDYCIAWLMGSSSGSLNTLWKELGALSEEVPIIDPEVFIRNINNEGQEFLIYKDMQKWEAYLKDIAPEDEEAISRMFSIINKFSFSGDIEELMKPKPLRKTLPALKIILKMWPTMIPMAKYGAKNCRQFIKEMGFKNEFLRYFLEKIYDENFSAIAFLMMFSLFKDNNAGYPAGGSLNFVLRILDKYQKLGGKLSAGKRVKKILVEDGKAVGVQLDDGTIHRSDYVIAACDLHTVIYDMLGGKYIPEDIKNAFETWPLFKPLVQISFGIKKEIKEKQMITTYLIPTKIGNTETDSYSITSYSFDPDMAPQGKTAMLIRFETPYEIWEHLEDDAYKKEKERIKEDGIMLLEKIYPDIKDFIEVVDVSTPLTDIKYTGVYRAAYEGFMPTKSNTNKIINPIIEGLDNFMLAGQWLFPGGGLPPSALSGKWAIEEFYRKE